MSTEITHDPDGQKFTITVDGKQAGFADYVRTGNDWDFNHTVVKPEYEGQGLASELIGHALEEAIAEGGRIIPTCPFVAKYVQRNQKFLEHTVTEENR